MRMRIGVSLAALGLFVLAAAPARAADTDDLAVNMAIFISPAGEPFQAPVTEPYPIVKWFERMDKNHDGKVDIEEFRADSLYVFDALDRDRSGALQSNEVNAYEQYVVPIITRANPLADPYADPSKLLRDQGAAYYGLFQEPEPLMSADRNFDFKVSRQEFADQADRHFKALDKAGKGYLTLDDLPKTAAEKAARATRVVKSAAPTAPVKPAAAATPSKP